MSSRICGGLLYHEQDYLVMRGEAGRGGARRKTRCYRLVLPQGPKSLRQGDQGVPITGKPTCMPARGGHIGFSWTANQCHHR